MSIELSFGEIENVKEEIVPVTTTQVLDETILSDEERETVKEFAKKINLNDSAGIIQYGIGSQKKMAEFSEKSLSKVRTNDLGEVGELLASVVNEVQSFDEDDKGLVGFFKKTANKIKALETKYQKADVNIARVCDSLEAHKVTLFKDITMFDKLYELNLAGYKELCMYIMAGKLKLEEIKAKELPELREKAMQSGRQEDAQAVNDLELKITRFEKKVHDLELTKVSAMQTAPTIRMIQNNDTEIADRINTLIMNVIPSWKTQIAIALGLEHSKKALETSRRVSDAANDIIRKNADKLKQSTIEIAKESERGVIDLETLKHANESLISTIDEVMVIQKAGKEARINAEVELQKLEHDLKNKLLEVR